MVSKFTTLDKKLISTNRMRYQIRIKMTVNNMVSQQILKSKEFMTMIMKWGKTCLQDRNGDNDLIEGG